MKRFGRVLRGGFVLPMALMATFIVMLIVSAGAYYCTNYLRTSGYYLTRTRCRLAAQSAIEAVKLRLQVVVGQQIPNFTGANYASDWQEKFTTLKSGAEREEILRIVPYKDCSIDYDFALASNGDICIYATASSASSGRTESMTLQETIHVNSSNLNLGLYAYFSNSDGFLTSKYLHVNGDVRANGDFMLSGSEINGYIYAGGEVVLDKEKYSQRLKILQAIRKIIDWEGNVTICPKGTYNSEYRRDSYAFVRPTNPMETGTEWAGGFEPVNETGLKVLRSLLGINTYEITHSTKSAAPFSKLIVNEGVEPIHIPQINDEYGSRLEDYRQYAANEMVTRADGSQQMGGSLSCMNCVLEDGMSEPTQLSALMKLYRLTKYEEVEDGWETKTPLDWYNNVPAAEKGDWEAVKGSRLTSSQAKKLQDYEKISEKGLLGISTWYKVDSYRKQKFKTNPVYGNTFLKRELRRIRVKNGYRVDVRPGDDQLDLILEKNGTNMTMLNDGDVVSRLRPFREDTGEFDYQCNAKTTADRGAVILIGTWDYPIEINGPVVFDSDVVIRGFVSGRGTIYSGRNIHIIGDIVYKDPPRWPVNKGEPDNRGKDMLALISKGSIVIGNYVADPKWTTDSNSVLKGNFINGDGNGRAYTVADYTVIDTATALFGGTFKKVQLNKNGSQYSLGDAPLRRYESVVGDYVFEATDYRNERAWNIKTYDPGFLNANYNTYIMKYLSQGIKAENYENADCVCRFSQFWDLNFGTEAFVLGDAEREGYRNYASYNAKAIDRYLRTLTTPRTEIVKNWKFSRIWNNDLWWSCNGYALNNDDVGGVLDPRMRYIQLIDAVLYSSAGIFGVIGGTEGSKIANADDNNGAVINGAIICQDEALIPFLRMQGSKAVNLTLNWDIRLNPSSEDAKRDELLSMGLPDTDSEAQQVAKPTTVMWQEVPDDFNPAN